MKVNLVKTLVLATVVLLAGCGRRSTQPLFGNGFIGSPQVGGNPNGSTGGNPTQTSVFIPQLIVTPSNTVNVGTTVTISVGNDGGLYNFRMGQTVSGLSFVGSATNIRQAYITSTVATTVTVFATPVSYSGTSQEGQVTVTFTSSGTTTTTPVSTSPSAFACRISGPYYSQWAAYGSLYSYSGNPPVGDSPLFSVSDLFGNAVQVTNVWTSNTNELARYFYQWDRFTLNLASAGSKTLFVRARSFTTGETCESQLTLQVGNQWQTPTPGPTGQFCGVYPATGAGLCTMIYSDSYYFDGSRCVYRGVPSGCAARGAFGTYQACQQAVSSGSCTSW